MNNFFITGTDTDCGKTLVTLAFMARARDQGIVVNGMKPIAAGADNTPAGLRNADAVSIQEYCSEWQDYESINPFCVEPAIAPHLATSSTHAIDIYSLTQHYRKLAEHAALTIVEGAGGWLIPLNQTQTLADLAADMRLPVVLIVGMRLGCLNHALLSVEAIQSRDVRLLGWVANQIDPAMQAYQENVETLVARIPAPLLGEIPYQENPDPLKIMSYLRFPWEGTTDQ